MLGAVVAGFTPPTEARAWPSRQGPLVPSRAGVLPPAVIGGICLRFRALPAPAQHVLGAAAALDERLSGERLGRATALDRPIVEGALDLLEWNRWLVADAQGYVFAAPIERAGLLEEMVTPGQACRSRGKLTA